MTAPSTPRRPPSASRLFHPPPAHGHRAQLYQYCHRRRSRGIHRRVASRRREHPDGDTHAFALVPDFGDNAQFTVVGNALRAGPTFAGGLGTSFSVRLHVTDSTDFDFEADSYPGRRRAAAQRRPQRIHYNSDDNTVREEFIEIYNATESVLDISQWRVRGGVDYYFPLNTFIGRTRSSWSPKIPQPSRPATG